MSYSKFKIPLVDLTNLAVRLKDNEIDRASYEHTASELDKALTNFGFAYSTNHGIAQEKIDRAFRVSLEFFQLPVEEKNKVKRNSERYDGYFGLKHETLTGPSSNLQENRESYNCNSYTGLYPDDSSPEFRESVCDLATEMTVLTHRLLKCFSIALGKEEEYLSKLHRFIFQGPDKNLTTLRTLYYPALTSSDLDLHKQKQLTRVGEHSDYGTFSLLIQDDIGGLEVLSDGEWIPAAPIEGAILVIIGDLMQRWTCDRYTATVHRVVVPEEEVKRKTHRQSLAFFVHADNDVQVSPLNGDPTNRYPPVGSFDYVTSRASTTYRV